MKKIRSGLIALSLLFCSATFANAQVSIGIGFPNVSIDINLPLFPELVPVPGYPVYYAPQVDANYFFYDGLYWVYQDDDWYASSWYDGPWAYVEPQVVPLFILRVPVRYYRQPPVYFRGWYSNAPPRWGQHWGRGWEQRRRGWDNWNRSSVPARAPRPTYQREYARDRYPDVEQQQRLRSQSYRYQPRDRVIRQHFQQTIEPRSSAPAQQGRQEVPQARSPRQIEPQRSAPVQRGGENIQRSTPPQQHAPVIQDRRQQPGAEQHKQQAPPPHVQEQKPHGRSEPQSPPRGRGQSQNRDDDQQDRGHGQNKDDDRGRGRDR